MRRYILIIVTIILILTLCGCRADTAKENVAATPNPAVTIVATPVSAPSPTPSPSVTEPETPEVAGCKSEVVDGEVLYYAEEGNPYGLEAGEVFGEFVPNVNIATEGENNVEGGWALSSKVVDKLLTQGSAETGEDLINTKIVLPLDISGLDKGNGVDIFGVLVGGTAPALLIEFKGDGLTLVDGYDNIDPDGNTAGGYIKQKLEWDLVKENGETVVFSGYGYTYDPNGNLFYCSADFSQAGNGSGYFFGDVVMNVMSPLVVINTNSPPKLDNIFTFQGLPVFLLANKAS